MNLTHLGQASRVAASCALVLFASHQAVWAATDGGLGAQSTASVRISLVVPPQVGLSNLTDIELTRRQGAATQASSPACIYARGTSSYQLLARGSGPSAAFELAGNNDRVSYQLRFDDGTGERVLTPSRTLSGLTGADSTSQNCRNTGNNGIVTVFVPSAESERIERGVYSGRLTLVIAPD